MSFNKLPSKASLPAEPFKINISDDKISKMKQLIELSPIADLTYESKLKDRSLGLNRDWLVNAVDSWQNHYDWKKSETHMNSFPHFKAPINTTKGTLKIHFAALFSSKDDAIPIILIHGWPGSFIEFLPMLDLYRKQYTPQTLPYHLIVPSLPGYAFSDAPPLDDDFTQEDVASVLHELMLGLGCSKGYVAQGGDLGSNLSRIMIKTYDECKAAHINFCIIREPPTEFAADAPPISEAEQEGLKRAQWFKQVGSAYAMEHATRPSTIGFALAASPIALLAWISEKFLDWTDQDPPLDTILESVSLYWLTGCYPTSIYPYRQLFQSKPAGNDYIQKPLGFSWFPKEIAPAPRRWVQTLGNLVFWRAHDQGGHFAALEEPEALKKDLENFVEQVWVS